MIQKITSIILLCALAFSAEADKKEYIVDYPGEQGVIVNKCTDIPDPYEKFNRKMFMFNSILDHFLLRPVAKGYRNVFSEGTRYRVGNFLDNLNVPLTMVNNTLQADGHNTLLSFWQFAINTTFGVAGIGDVAQKTGLKVEPQTFGSTLAHYGVAPGPYIVLPIFGSSNFRDMFDTPIANRALNPLSYVFHRDFRYIVTGTRLVHERSEILPFTDHVTQTSTDPYIAIRSALYQRRETKVHYPSYYRCNYYE